MAKFEKITHVKISRYSGKPLAANSVKQYVKLLNNIAAAEIDTKEKLIHNQQEVITLIDLYVDGDDEAKKFLKRQYYSAIFYALDEYHNDLKKEYYDAFQKVKAERK
jgi:ATP-dependent protease Clp ATPase subunit